MKARSLWILGLSLVLGACGGSRPEPGQPAPFSIERDHLKIDPGSRFAKRLELAEAQAAPGEERTLRVVGQMIALANPSGELSGARISWVELGPGVTKEAGLSLGSQPGLAVGTAFGVATLPAHYLGQIHAGEKVQISRYGLSKGSTTGTIVSTREQAGEPELAQVVFRIARGNDWYPGTNCQIEFPLLRSQPVRVSKSALLTEGLREFVYKRVAPGEFVVKHVSVVGETAEDAFVLGDLKAGDQVIGRGAILLKPLAHDLAGAEKERGEHAYP